MTFLIIAGIVGILWAIPSPQPTVVINVDRTTHVHVRVQNDVKIVQLPQPPVSTEGDGCKPVPTTTALGRYQEQDLPDVPVRKFLA